MARSIAGLFEDRGAAERAIEDLKTAGFDASRIGAVTQDKQTNREIAEEHGTATTEGAVAGSLIGGTAGAILAATGTLVIPGIGPFVSAGILATALVGGAAGWLVGGLVGLGIPKEEAEYYQGRVEQGATLVTVDAQGRDAEAREILLRDGAEDLQDRGYGGGYDATQTTTTAGSTGTGTTGAAQANVADTEDVRVPVMEEELVAGTRQEEIGHVHLHKEVVEEQESVPVTLQREQVTVERVPVSGPADAGTVTEAFQEQDIDVPVLGEEAVVAKQAHEVEEVRLHKEAVTEQEQVTDTVRKERVVVGGVDDQAVTDQGTLNAGRTLNDPTR